MAGRPIRIRHSKTGLKKQVLTVMAGRPIGTTKDSNRKRVINPNGRKIDYKGPSYENWIKKGYKLNSDETKLVIDNNFNPETVVIRQRGRPKSVITSGYEKVKNPDSGREIKTNTQYFRKLANKYGYDKENNIFLMYIIDPRNADRKIVKHDETFKKYVEKHGYIYDQKDNSFSIPSQKSADALNSGMKAYELKIVNKDDPLVQLNQLDTRMNFLLNTALRKQKGIKFNIGFKIKFIKTVDGVETKDSSTISETCITITHKSEIKEAVKLQKEGLLRQIDRFTNGGSGLRIHRITRNFINIYKYKPLRARGFIILPDKINNKKATINIQNKDDKCFIYCLGRRFDPNPESKNLERVSKHLKKTCCDLGFDKIKTPVTVKDIPKIEKEYSITINLVGHNDGELFPITQNKEVVDENKHIDLLITSREDENHYVWIKDFNKLLYQQTKHHGRKEFCKN